jgi:hypothetical protein
MNSENTKNLQSDIFRIYQIEKGRANKDHPYRKILNAFFLMKLKYSTTDVVKIQISSTQETNQPYWTTPGKITLTYDLN